MYICRARAERAAAQDEDAARDLDFVIKADDRYPIAYSSSAANLHAESTETTAAMLEDYDRAIRLKGTQPEFFINCGNARNELGEQDAVACRTTARRFIDSTWSTPTACFNRSLIYAKLGKRELAAQDRACAIKLDSGTGRAQRAYDCAFPGVPARRLVRAPDPHSLTQSATISQPCRRQRG